MAESWDGRIRSFRIRESAAPELYRDLDALNGRDRGERVRTLATIGLAFLKRAGEPQQAITSPAAQMEPIVNTDATEKELEDQKKALMKRLKVSTTS